MRVTCYLLIILPVFWIGLRIAAGYDDDPGLISQLNYEITYEYQIDGRTDSLSIETYLPQNSVRQDVTLDSTQFEGDDLKLVTKNENQTLFMGGYFNSDTTITISYKVQSRSIEFIIDEDLTQGNLQPRANEFSLHSHNVSVSIDPEIILLADELQNIADSSIKSLSNQLYQYVRDIPSAGQTILMSAKECLELQRCSDIGKSRLLAALFNANNIPARVVGGVILTEDTQSIHRWTEANIGGNWIPFDTYEGHFAQLPSNYLRVITGDYSFVTSDSNNPQNFKIRVNLERTNHYPNYAILNIWQLIDSDIIPLQPLLVLLLLPLGAYLVAIFKNVIGLDTYGVFLPVLIAFALMNMGVMPGLVFFTMIIGLIGILNIPLTKWEILHTPKIVILLTAVAIISLISIQLFFQTGWVKPSATLTFPMIILTIISESFARKIEEESFQEALFIYAQTIIVTLTCTWILSSDLLQYFFLTFPEALLIVAGMSLLLGKWIGLRLIEYDRFASIDKEVKSV